MMDFSLARFLRALFFIFGSLLIIYIGILPADFEGGNFQTSALFFAWAAAFIVRRPKSVGTLPVILCAIFYLIYNDEGVALGAVIYIIFCFVLQEFHDWLLDQSFVFELIFASGLFFFLQLFKNLILQLFFTHTLPIFDILRFTIYFAIAYAIFTVIIQVLIGRRKHETVR